MFRGKIVEQANTEALWHQPKNSYTKSLLEAIPIADPNLERDRLSPSDTSSSE